MVRFLQSLGRSQLWTPIFQLCFLNIQQLWFERATQDGSTNISPRRAERAHGVAAL